MQDWETLKVILSSHIRELDQAWSHITRLQEQEEKTTERTTKMENEVINLKQELKQIAEQMERDAKTFNVEVTKRAGEMNKQTFMRVALALLGLGALGNGTKIDFQAVWQALNGGK